MIPLVITSLLFCQVLGDPIVKGHISEINTNPWLVSIYDNGSYICGGSIISNSIILTAAHCTESFRDYIVRVGSSRIYSGGSTHRVVAKRQHENPKINDYGTLLSNDVALMKVAPPIEFSSGVAKIQLAEKGFEIERDTGVRIAGWGSQSAEGQSSEVLRSTMLRIVDSGECSRRYDDRTGTQVNANSLICAALPGTDSCLGDSGSPLVMGENIQVGILSWGMRCAGTHPAIFGDVAYYRDWIDSMAGIMESTRYPGE